MRDMSRHSKTVKIAGNTGNMARNDTPQHPDGEILLVAGSIPVRGTKCGPELRFYCFNEVRRVAKSDFTHVFERKVGHVIGLLRAN